MGGCNKLNVFDWLSNMQLPNGQQPFDGVEVRFKNSRKEFFRNTTGHLLATGDVVAVESSPGHDIGTVSLTGELVRVQMARRNVKVESGTLKKIYRKAKPADIEKWQEAQGLEKKTMIRSRVLASQIGLQMKIGDVEYQGDKSKAIFYYTADDRVDFRELIRVLADEFRVRIEMRQIGSRQEAARIGGIGTCGRELCCSTWLSDFRSVTTSAARYQQLSLNPIKLAGQCGKLKCCLNYELDSYLDALKHFPENYDIETAKGKPRHQKTDIFRGILWYTFHDEPDNFIAVPLERVKEIIELNKRGEKPESLLTVTQQAPRKREPDFENVVGQDSLTRFDNTRRNKQKKKNNNSKQQQGQQKQHNPSKQAVQQNQQQRQQKGQQPRNPQAQQQNRPRQQKPSGQAPNNPKQSRPQPGKQQGQRPQQQQRKNDPRRQSPQGPPPSAPPPSTPPPFV
jgi:cell fate regulator YaaT (PSP1 superfamily)